MFVDYRVEYTNRRQASPIIYCEILTTFDRRNSVQPAKCWPDVKGEFPSNSVFLRGPGNLVNFLTKKITKNKNLMNDLLYIYFITIIDYCIKSVFGRS